ncbi:hypothetical protein HX021_08195 [Sphingobacterium sp. N143]|uniref:hypothetical protein n=1 Tax=Sphingobacterium sp. N143 TaxID=2746727 RepID=UPI002577C444|nr:hypothetical protein [Sphingobacterium sp. N143]MDM1294277.1 hypothetical protein [Sphingobacterium sp. N143]
MEKLTQEHIEFEHDKLRKELWAKAWIGTASSSNCTTTSTCNRFADEFLSEFDKRFSKTKKTS